MKNNQECDNINDSVVRMILLTISKASSAIMQMEKYKRRKKEEENKENGSDIQVRSRPT